jgi:phosphopantothenoylcysteine decarboxylase/phosphopantothenate--cysteine ligase
MNDALTTRVVLGVSGGIAAYKSPDLVRRLRERGAHVRVVMTRGACQFVTPLTFQAVSGHPVHVELLDERAEAAMGHIELARWADLVLVAPATAHCIARLAHGLADDLLTTLCLATEAPVHVAPAMNRQMWRARAVHDNVARLVSLGVRVHGPGTGDQACGEVGEGRMLEPAELADAVLARPGAGALAGLRAMVTAGPTLEALDPVRFLSNHSSGKMGYAVACAARDAGAEVTLVSGPTALESPAGVATVNVQSAEEMRDAVMSAIARQDIFVAAAAVADYRPVRYSSSKIKKSESEGEAERSLALERTPDILAQVGRLEPGPFTVGFAAETDDVGENARGKLARKGLDLIAANRVGVPGSGFGGDENDLTVYWEGGHAALGHAPKVVLARRLIEVIAEHYRGKRPAEDPRPAARR